MSADPRAAEPRRFVAPPRESGPSSRRTARPGPLTRTAPRSRVGILALQGDVRPHAAAFTSVGASTHEVRRPEALADLDALVLPGGESTTLLHLLGDLDAWDRHIRDLLERGGGLLATCAGLIVLAREVRPRQPSLALLDVEIERNGWGRQIESFELDLPLDGGSLEAVFIRAPRIVAVGSGVEVLATIDDQPRGAEPVLVRQGPILAATFHPELTPDRRLQRLFLGSLARSDRGASPAAGTRGPEGGDGKHPRSQSS